MLIHLISSWSVSVREQEGVSYSFLGLLVEEVEELARESLRDSFRELVRESAWSQRMQ